MKTMRELINLMEDAYTDISPPSEQTFSSSPEYQNYKSRTVTANQNKINNTSKIASNNATLSAHSSHTSPIYSTQGEWNNWVRKGGLEYAREMDLDHTNDSRVSQFKKDGNDQQNYVRSQLNQNTNEENDTDSQLDSTNQQNAQYAQTHYSQPADDTLSTDGTFSDNMAYQNHASRTKTAQNNRTDFAQNNANYKANLSANSQHTSPVYSSAEEWNQWVKQGGLDYAQQMDIYNSKKQQSAKFDVDYAERKSYIDSLNNQKQQQSKPVAKLGKIR